MQAVLLAIGQSSKINEINAKAQYAQNQALETQEELKNELQTRVMIVSNLAHRMNNPLNYIETGISSLNQDLKDHERELMALFSADQSDPEGTAHVSLIFSKRINAIRQTLKNIQLGIQRSAASVTEIRSLSGIDGNNQALVEISELVQKTIQRLEESMGQCKEKIRIHYPPDNDCKLYVNIYTLVITFELLISQWYKTLNSNLDVVLECETGRDSQKVSIALRQNANTTKHSFENKELISCITYLLKPHDIDISACPEFVSFTLTLPTLPKSRDLGTVRRLLAS